MNCRTLAISLCLAGVMVLAVVIATAQQPKEPQPGAGGPPEMKLPPGWTEADMQACMAAGTPGRRHEHLTRDVGVWQGKNTMWMGPGAEPVLSECTATIKSIMDGRFVRCEISGDMPGMGPFNGFGIYGFDNVTQQYVTAWIDNCGTGIMNGTGELSADGKTMTWELTYNCPITKKPAVMREVETITGPNTKTFEMYGPDPKTGKEYKMMTIEYTRKS